MTSKKPIKEILGVCITKVEEHYKLKDLYKQLNQGMDVERILQETVEDYKDKMHKYILGLLEEVKSCNKMLESLRGEQRQDVEENLRECEKDLYCTIAELFELYHFFRQLEQLSKEQLNEAVSIPVEIIYNLLMRKET